MSSSKGKSPMAASESSTDAIKPAEQERSLENLFQRCLSHISEISKQTPADIATQLGLISRRIDNSYFRLQIWGSDLGADLDDKENISIDNILNSTDRILSEEVQDTLQSFQQYFNIISESLQKLEKSKIVAALEMNEQRVQDVLSNIQSATEAISILVQSLMVLSDSTQKQASQSVIPDPWDQQYILTLDGGGVRGYTSLLILKTLMDIIAHLEQNWHDSPHLSSYSPLMALPGLEHRKQDRPVYLPCHYFDYIVGTSSGGLIAIMLSRLRMTVDSSLKEFRMYSNELYGKGPYESKLNRLLGFNKYDHRKLETLLRRTVSRRAMPNEGNDAGKTSLRSPPEMCRTIVTAFEQEKGITHLFRSYENALADSRADNLPVWQVARATSATPLYFKPMRIGTATFLDGGMGANNPVLEALSEVRQMNENSSTAIAAVVSIGTGLSKPLSRVGTAILGERWRLFEMAKRFETGSEETHRTMSIYADTRELPYYRLNVTKGLEQISLDEWKRKDETMIDMIAATKRYLQESHIHEKLLAVGRMLVENRRRRSKTSRWELFSGGYKNTGQQTSM